MSSNQSRSSPPDGQRYRSTRYPPIRHKQAHAIWPLKMSARKRALWPGLFHLEGLRHFLFICRNIIRRARIRLSSYVSAIFHRSTKLAIPMRHKQANERQPRSTDRVDPRPVVVTLSACLRAHPHAWPLSARSGPCFFHPLVVCFR